MRIRCGYTVALDTFAPTPMVLLLNVRPERQPDLRSREVIAFDPAVVARQFRDPFGNVATRILVPGGRITMSADFEIEDHGRLDDHAPDAREIPVHDLPDEALPFLLGSRYCDTDKLSQTAWNLFGGVAPGWNRVQAIVDYAHGRLRFDYMQTDATRSAFDGHGQKVGVCRDFPHLAITLCRCMNISARYATGYLGDIGVPKDPAPMDFSAWFEVFLDGPAGPRWYTFDARHNRPRIGRIVMAYGRDATDCAITTSFGPSPLAPRRLHGRHGRGGRGDLTTRKIFRGRHRSAGAFPYRVADHGRLAHAAATGWDVPAWRPGWSECRERGTAQWAIAFARGLFGIAATASACVIVRRDQTPVQAFSDATVQP